MNYQLYLNEDRSADPLGTVFHALWEVFIWFRRYLSFAHWSAPIYPLHSRPQTDRRPQTTDSTPQSLMALVSSSQAACSGLGLALAEACLEHDATVIISSSQESHIQKGLEGIPTHYPSAKDRVSDRP